MTVVQGPRGGAYADEDAQPPMADAPAMADAPPMYDPPPQVAGTPYEFGDGGYSPPYGDGAYGYPPYSYKQVY